MILFKRCPKCKGDMKLDKDVYGPYLECLQCGYMVEPRANNAEKELASSQKKAA